MEEAKEGLMDGGSHLAKISATLLHLQSLDASHDDDLVLLIDAYDIWFQLPKSALVARYFDIINHANKRLVARLGEEAMAQESISQTIVFGSGKRCAPNQIHTIACYPIPDSPLPDDMYYNNTDTDLGQTEQTFHKHRWLNSGSIMGPVKDMRDMFARAEEIVKSHPEEDPEDNGTHGSVNIYHGSDQSIFAKMWGEQEYQREVIRRRYGGDPRAGQNHGTNKEMRGTGKLTNLWRRLVGSQPVGIIKKHLSKRGTGNVDALRPYDILSPPFTHEHMDPLDGHPAEFGIGVDYFADLSHQTVNSVNDVRWLLHNQPLADQITDRTRWDCKWRLPEDGLPADILSEESMEVLWDILGAEGEEQRNTTRWEDQLLYTHLCLGTIPVMIHHNGDKEARELLWDRLWWHQYAKGVLESNLQSEELAEMVDWEGHIEQPRAGTGAKWGGAWTAGESHDFLKYDDMCSREWDDELFR